MILLAIAILCFWPACLASAVGGYSRNSKDDTYHPKASWRVLQFWCNIAQGAVR